MRSGHGHRLLLVVRDVDRGDAERLLQLADLGAHVDAQPRVEVAKRLVEQQDLRADDERARDGDALQLAARELVRPALAVARELHQRQRLVDPARDLRTATLRAFRP